VFYDVTTVPVVGECELDGHVREHDKSKAFDVVDRQFAAGVEQAADGLPVRTSLSAIEEYPLLLTRGDPPSCRAPRQKVARATPLTSCKACGVVENGAPSPFTTASTGSTAAAGGWISSGERKGASFRER